jgi:hypothetical protein
MWYAYEGDAGIGTGLIMLDPERVREIVTLNKEGVKPKDLTEFTERVAVKEPDYGNVVGQDSLNRFEHAFKNKKKKKNPRHSDTRNNNNEPRSAADPSQQNNTNRNRRRNKRRGGNDKRNTNENNA